MASGQQILPMTRLTLILVAFGWLAGCGPGGVPLGNVSGHITKNGKPESGITVKFEPESGGRQSLGLSDASGAYELIFTERKGALLGKHRVTVETAEKLNDALVVTAPAKVYLSTEREVQSGSNTFDFDIGKAEAAK
jgi:hypothetical protein